MSGTNGIMQTTLGGLPYVTVRDADGCIVTVPFTYQVAAALARSERAARVGEQPNR